MRICSTCGGIKNGDPKVGEVPCKCTPTETPTPLTDAATFTYCSEGEYYEAVYVAAAKNMERQLTAATAQLEEARRDKERLEAVVANTWKIVNPPGCWELYEMGRGLPSFTAESFRAVIDAAMQQKEGK